MSSSPVSRKPGPRPTIAMLMVIRNEERFLREHLLYHHAIGIDRAFLFFDRTMDRSIEMAREFPWVRSFELDPAEGETLPYIADIHVLAMDYCLDQCRKEGTEWLIALDPDEFAYADNRGLPGNAPLDDLWRDADLKALLAGQPDEADQVRLATREILACSELDDKPFYHQVWFHGEAPVTFRIRNPASDEIRDWDDFLGHRQGQAFVRTRLDVQGYDSHRFTANQHMMFPERPVYEGLKTVEADWHAHYYVTSIPHWMEKFKKHDTQPSSWPLNKPVEFSILSAREARARLSPPEAEAFCRETFFFSDEQIQAALAEGRAREDQRLKRLIESVAQTPSPSAPPGTRPEPISLLKEVRKLHPPERQAHTWDLSPQRIPPERRDGFSVLRQRRGTFYRRAKNEASVTVELEPGHYRLEVRVYPCGDLVNLWSLSIRVDRLPTGPNRKDWIKGTVHTRFRVPPEDGTRPVTVRLQIRRLLGRRLKCPVHSIQLTREGDS